MSKITLTPHASGTGTLNIAAPNTNSTRTLTLPDADLNLGNVLTTASDVVAAKLTGALPAISGAALTDLPAGGKVLQVVSQQFSGIESFAGGGTYFESTLSLSITPASASNKIFVTVLGGMIHGLSTYARSYVTIYRDSTTNLFSTGTGQNQYTNANGYIPLAMSVLDSPATTSAVNYKVYFKSDNGVIFGEQDATATITLMEIAG